MLDYYAANIALKYTQGIYSGPESRGGTRYGPGPRTATEYLGWLWFGPDQPDNLFSSTEYIQAVHAATSTYAPPSGLTELARKAVPKPAVYRLAKPDYRMTRAGLSQETYRIENSFTAGTVQAPLGEWTRW